MLIDEPSIGLSPLMVQQTFAILKELRDRGVGIVLELGQTRLVDRAERVLGDPRIEQLFLGGAMSSANSE